MCKWAAPWLYSTDCSWTEKSPSYCRSWHQMSTVTLFLLTDSFLIPLFNMPNAIMLKVWLHLRWKAPLYISMASQIWTASLFTFKNKFHSVDEMWSVFSMDVSQGRKKKSPQIVTNANNCNSKELKCLLVQSFCIQFLVFPFKRQIWYFSKWVKEFLFDNRWCSLFSGK